VSDPILLVITVGIAAVLILLTALTTRNLSPAPVRQAPESAEPEADLSGLAWTEAEPIRGGGTTDPGPDATNPGAPLDQRDPVEEAEPTWSSIAKQQAAWLLANQVPLRRQAGLAWRWAQCGSWLSLALVLLTLASALMTERGQLLDRPLLTAAAACALVTLLTTGYLVQARKLRAQSERDLDRLQGLVLRGLLLEGASQVLHEGAEPELTARLAVALVRRGCLEDSRPAAADADGERNVIQLD
jgi:hypothetical protein